MHKKLTEYVRHIGKSVCWFWIKCIEKWHLYLCQCMNASSPSNHFPRSYTLYAYIRVKRFFFKFTDLFHPYTVIHSIACNILLKLNYIFMYIPMAESMLVWLQNFGLFGRAWWCCKNCLLRWNLHRQFEAGLVLTIWLGNTGNIGSSILIKNMYRGKICTLLINLSKMIVSKNGYRQISHKHDNLTLSCR